MGKGVSLRRIGKSFDAVRVLADVSLEVGEGEFLSLVGPSGCGKSTLLRIIAGLETQDSGTVAIGGQPVDHLRARDRNVSMVFQNYALYPHMSVADNVALPLTMTRLSLPERLPFIKHLSPRRPGIMRAIRAEVSALAGQLQIDPLLARKPGQLSGGQRQRVALARAMVRQPSVFLMDEPLSNLDARLRVHMRSELADLHKRLGATFIYVTHDQIEAMTMSSRVALMDGGEILQLGTPSELYDRPASLKVAQFIGSPAINVLPVVTEAAGALLLHGRRLPLAIASGGGRSAKLAIRPEALRLGPAGALADPFALAGRVRRIEHHGAERIVHAELADPEGGTVIARLSESEAAHAALRDGAAVAITFDPTRAHVFDMSGNRIAVSAFASGAARMRA